MITAEQLQAQAVAAGSNVAWLAYEMTTLPERQYPLGYMAFKQDRWDAVRKATGVTVEVVPEMTGLLFGPLFTEECASYVRRHFGFSP